MEATETENESKQSSSTTHSKYREYISDLETTQSRISTTFGDLYHYQGFWYPPFYLEGIMSVQDHFQENPNDLLLSSTIKTGTTWFKAFAIAIRTRYMNTSSSPLLTTVPHECVPFLKIDLVPDSSLSGTSTLSHSHALFVLAKFHRNLEMKIVYIYRDPKDAFVSLWHFMRKLTPKDKEPIGLEEVFGLFVKGVTGYSPFWDHVLSYWRTSLERSGTILVLKYEDAKSRQ